MSRKSILLVDQDEDSIDVYSTILQHLGYRVIAARSAEDGIRLASEEVPDVIFLELFRRTPTGWYTVEALRSIEVLRDVPLVALTARVLTDDLSLARTSGCDLVLTKPLEPSRLAEIVVELLNEDLPLGTLIAD